MEDFAKSVAQEQGIDEATVQTIMNKVLQFFKEKAPKEVSDSITENVPAAEGATPETSSNNPCMPVLEMLKKLLSQFGMDNAVQALEGGEIASIITKAGVTPEQGASMIQKLIDFLKEKCGPETVDKLLSEVPAVKSFVDTAAAA